MRIILFAGKGGVGKTSVAAATGVRTAEMGLRTVILSLDVAHSLSDVFDLDVGLMDRNRGKPVQVADQLWIQELDVQEEIRNNWGDIHRYLSLLLNTSGLDEILAEELAVLPGMEEVSLLLHINRYVQTNRFDVILLDCAPTGESLRFISIPTTLEWYIQRIFKMERTLVRVARPFAKRLYDVPLPGEDYFNAIEALFERLQGVDRVLADPEITTVRLVSNPEKMVLKETQRAFMYFCLYRMTIDAVVMNRVLPPEAAGGFFQDWRKVQDEYVAKAERDFHPVPVFPIHLFSGEVLGPDRLTELSRRIYGDRNPLDRFFTGPSDRFSREEGETVLTVTLPFAAKEDLEINKVADELIIRLGGFKRHILLPRPLLGARHIRAAMDGRQLSIRFGGNENGTGTEEQNGTNG